MKLEDEIMRELRYSGWMRSYDIHARIALDRKIGAAGWRRWLSAHLPGLYTLLCEPGFGALAVALGNLESSGTIVSRWRDDPPEVLARRGGRRAREYRIVLQ